MKVQEIIQRIQSLYSKGVQSDDTRLTSRHIYNKLITVRARLVSQEAKKKQRISRWNYQTLPCVELIEVSAHDCPCLPPIGCMMVRSKYKLPKPLSGLDKNLIQSVQTIDRGLKIDEITMNAMNSLRGNKFTSKKLNFFIQDGYLYITVPTKIRIVSVTGLFEDPLEVKKFPNFCQTEDCVDCGECLDFTKEDFPIDNDMIDALIELSLTELVQLFGAGIEDLYNDSRDNRQIIRKGGNDTKD